MTELMTLIDAHGAELLAALGIGYLLLSVFVAMTPTKDDDKALSRLRAALEKASFLQPRDGEGMLSLPGRPARREAKLLERPRHHSGTIPCPQCLAYESVIACSMCNGTGGIPDGLGARR